MVSIIETYNQMRDWVVDHPNDTRTLNSVLEDGHFQKPDLEKLALHLSDSIIKDKYENPKPFYPLTDLFNIGRLKKEKNIFHPDEVLSAIYHIIDDYLLPIKEQKYGFGHNLTEVLNAVIELNLEQRFDIEYINKAIERAKEDGHIWAVNSWGIIKNKILNGKKEKS